MALPANVDLVTVTGTYVYVDGTPATGKVTFTPSLSSWIQDAGAPATLLPRTITATLDIAGKISVPLPATDDPDLAPNGWTYDVVEDFGSGLTRKYAIGVPTSAGTIDLATVAPVTPVSGGSKVVTKVNGKVPDINGAVVLTPSDIGALPATYTPPAAPVQSVSGKTGIVLLTASDVGALPVDYPVVQSVNGKTGSSISIGPAEIGALPANTTAADIGALTVEGGMHASSAHIDVCSAPYNATPGADITTALQAALDWLATNAPNGGDVYFSKPGTYLINGAPRTGTAQGYAYNGQILIPPVSLASSRPIRIRGAFPSSGGGESTGAPNGVILKSNATSGYVFDIQPGFTQFGCPWTGAMPIFEDIVIRTSNNPTCGGLNLQCTQRTQIRRVQIDTPTSWVPPTSGSLAALVLPQVYNNGDITIRDTTIRGYPIGVVITEHGVFDNVDIAYCGTAFKANGRSHSNWFGYVDVEECPTVFDGGAAPAFGIPAVPAGSVIFGHMDYENIKPAGDPLAAVSWVTDTDSNPIVGKIDFWGTMGGSQPTKGGRQLDVVPLTQTPSIGPRSRGASWQSSHPYDNFARVTALSGAGAPGQCSPSLHPWRVESGSFSVSGGALKGLTGTDRCFVPCLGAASYGGVSRTITCKFTLGATSPQLRLYASAVVNSTGTSMNAGATALEVRVLGGGQVTLRANNTNITAAGPTIAASSTHTLQLAVYHNALGYPNAVKVYLDGALIIASGIPAASASLGGLGPSVWPYYEDGLYLQDTGTAVTLFGVQALTADPAYVGAGTTTLAAGTVTVANNAITATSLIRVFTQSAGGTVGALSVALTAGTGFTINSTSAADTSQVYYEIVSY